MQYSDLGRYDYHLPEDLIAQKPSVPRDSCRLLVYHRQTKKISDDYFYNLGSYLPKESLLVMNNSKVVLARIMAKRQTGGKVELLLLSYRGPVIKAMLSRQLHPQEKIVLNGGQTVIVLGQQDRFYQLAWHLPIKEKQLYLERYGQMPVPPYIKHPDSLAKLKTQYQTVFAKHLGSVAAPTASLHFSKRMLKSLAAKQIKTAFVTLHVGLGTFLPLTAKNFAKGQLHQESYRVSQATWNLVMQQHRQRRTIVAVGTTVARTLEAITRTLELEDETRLFIRAPYRFKLVNALLTNFHLPKSSLLLLVEAFIGDYQETLNLYHYAIKQRYRFYSFGDAMLIL